MSSVDERQVGETEALERLADTAMSVAWQLRRGIANGKHHPLRLVEWSVELAADVAGGLEAAVVNARAALRSQRVPSSEIERLLAEADKAVEIDRDQPGPFDGYTSEDAYRAGEHDGRKRMAAQFREVLRASGEATAGGWRTMESAPRDGTPVLGWLPERYQGAGASAVVLWQDESWWDNSAFVVKPKLWMPLPSAPTDDMEG